MAAAGVAVRLAESKELVDQLGASAQIRELSPAQRRALRTVQRELRSLVLDGRMEDLELVTEALDVLRRSLVLDLVTSGEGPREGLGDQPLVVTRPAPASATDSSVRVIEPRTYPPGEPGADPARASRELERESALPPRRTSGSHDPRSAGVGGGAFAGGSALAGRVQARSAEHGAKSAEAIRTAADRVHRELVQRLQELPAVIGVSAGPSPREDPATRAGPPRAVPTTTRPSPLAPRPLAALAPVPPATRATRPAPPSVASGPTAPPSTGIRSPSVGPATAPTWAPRPVVSLPAGLPAVRPLPPIPAPSVAPAESGRGLDDRTVPASDLDPFHEPVHPRRVTAPPLEPGPVEVGRIRRRTYVLAGVRAVGIALVCFVLYALYGTALLEGHAQRHLDPSTHLRLSSVNIGLDELVLGSDSAGNLRKGPGLAAGSGLPGSAAPIVIMGHRTAAGGPFRHLSALRPGASIVLRSPGGPTYTYVVDGLVTTTPRAVIRPSPGAQVLYLVTAAPAYQDGRRLVVVARSLTGPRANPVSQAYRLPGLGGSPASAVEAVLLLGLLGAGWVARSRWRLDLPRWVVWGAWVPALLVTYAASVLLLGGMSRLL